MNSVKDTGPTEETIFTWGAPPLKFGAGASDEVGFEMSGYGVRRVLIVTDAGDPRARAARSGSPTTCAATASSRRSSTGCTSSPPTTR